MSIKTKLKGLDILVLIIDLAVRERMLGSRSLAADARLNYGTPWEYENLTGEQVAYYTAKLAPKIPKVNFQKIANYLKTHK